MALEDIPEARWRMAVGQSPNGRLTADELQAKLAKQGFVEGWGTILKDGFIGLAEKMTEAVKAIGRNRIKKTQEKS